MNAGSEPGTWWEDIANGYTMKIEKDSNIITVFAPRKQLLTYEINGGIYPEDIERVREHVIENFNLKQS